MIFDFVFILESSDACMQIKDLFMMHTLHASHYIHHLHNCAGSENEEKQRENRAKVLELADYIVPGHGPIFKVPR